MTAGSARRFRPGLESFEARDVPAVFTFSLPGGTATGQFADPTGVDPTQAVQSIPVPDLAVTASGADATVDTTLTPVATYHYGVLADVLASIDVAAGGVTQQFLLSGGTATVNDPATYPISNTSNAQDAPYVTINFTGMLPVSQVTVTVRLNNDVVRTVIVNLVGTDWNPVNGTPVVGAVSKVKNALKSAGFEVDVAGNILTIWGSRDGTAQVENVNFAVTGQFPGIAVPPPLNLPDVKGENGATANAIFKFAASVQ